MKIVRIARLGTLAALLVIAPPVAVRAAEAPATKSDAIATTKALQEAFVQVAQRVKPSVVTIYVERSPQNLPSSASKPGAKPDDKTTPNKPGAKPDKPDPDDDPFDLPTNPRDPRDRRSSLGTGMVIRPDGYILTNFHVVKGATFVRVAFNADSERPDRANARVVAVDPETDLAVIKVERAELRAVEFADSDAVQIGEWAIAVGSPFEQAQSVTAGIISAKGRHLDEPGKPSLPDYIQTDASINPGNSGGPLVNLDGKVIGINTAILSPSRFNVGIGFSLPSNTISALLPLLLEGKRVTRGFLGIQYVPLEVELAREFGVPGGMQIGALAKANSPAGKAGLQVDDIITAVDGKPVAGSDEFRRLVTGRAPGAKVTLTVTRPFEAKPEAHDYVVTLGDWAAGTNTTLDFPVVAELGENVRLGLEVDNFDKLSAFDKEAFSAAAGAKGVYVVDVVPGSSADDARVNRGLRVVRVRVSGGEWQDVALKAAYERLEKALAPGARVLVQLKDREDVGIYKLLVVPAAKAPKVVASAAG